MLLFVVWCVLRVACCVLIVAWCVSGICLLFAVLVCSCVRLFVFFRLLFVRVFVCWLLFVAYCALFGVRCVVCLFVGCCYWRCSVFGVCCLLRVECCLLDAFCCVLCVVCFLLLVV